MALILTIDTTTSRAGVALLESHGSGEEATVRAARRAVVTVHSEALLEMIDAVLGEAGTRPHELAAIACAAGPGSFTGLRIGLATAKGLCLGLSKPLLLVPSLAALVARVRATEETLVFACIDAFKGEVYIGRYRSAEGLSPVLIGAEETLSPTRLCEELRARAAEGPVVLVGDGMVRWPELRIAELTAIDEGPPDPVDVGRLAALRWARGERDDLASACPRYIRLSEAELLERQRSGSQPT